MRSCGSNLKADSFAADDSLKCDKLLVLKFGYILVVDENLLVFLDVFIRLQKYAAHAVNIVFKQSAHELSRESLWKSTVGCISTIEWRMVCK